MASFKSVCMAALMLLLISSSLISGTPPPSPKLNAPHHSNLHSLGEGVVDTKTQPPLHSSLKGCEGNNMMKGKNEGNSYEDGVGNNNEDIDYDSDKDDIKTR
nr:uncharacterized protein DDB_G0290685-like [Ipomoea trifida]